MGLALEVINITKLFGSLRAVDDVSVGVDEKSVTILIGPNGSGKTTLVNVISGLYRPDESLSGGQMKLLEIGRCLMSGAKMLLLDEPISGVNPTLAHEIFDKLVRLKVEFGVTFFIIEHRLDIALAYVDSVVAMAFGKLIAAGDPEIIMADQRVIDSYLGG